MCVRFFPLMSFIALSMVTMFSCTPETQSVYEAELTKVIGDKTRFILPDSDDFASIPQTSANPLTADKVALGKLLFHEPMFSNVAKTQESNYTYTCSTCHVADAGFRPGRQQGIADGAYGFGVKGESRAKVPTYKESDLDAQGARPLATLNTAYVTNSMWNGSFGSEGVNIGTEDVWGKYDPTTALNALKAGALESQNIAGLSTHRMFYSKELITKAGYKAMFDAAFPNWSEEDKYSNKGASFAISAYLRTLLTNEAPFQKWLKGNSDAMTEQEKQGASIFFGKAGCVTCHYEKNLGSMNFAALGVKDHYEMGGLNTSESDRRNLGRGGFTGKDEDMYKFRTPQLYNLGDSGPYFHGGSKNSLEEVVRYFNTGVVENIRVPKTQIAEFIKPIGLSEEEIQALTQFLQNGLRDPNLKRYVPSSVLSRMCFPNNDLTSKIDMDCF